MANVVVVGSQWGDEGKGKIVDWLSEKADIVVRFQGGHNAGHTLVIDGVEYKLSLLPSGIVRSGKFSVIGNGVVVDPGALAEEMDRLAAQGVEIGPGNLMVSRAAPLILPVHSMVDKARETIRGEGAIGTTGRGIGPAYEDKVARRGLRMADLMDRDSLKDKVAAIADHHNVWLKAAGGELADAGAMADKLLGHAERVVPFLGDVWERLDQARRDGSRVLFEGAQGVMLDIDHGTYPFVTSSNTVPGQAAAGSGIGPGATGYVLGITKAYTTRVGAGPFPTEDGGSEGTRMGERGHEFGTVTGRKRRCGWFDAVMVRQAGRIAGIDGMALTKLDVLDGFELLKVCTGYRLGGGQIDRFPSSPAEQAEVEPVYEEIEGWAESTEGARSWAQLPPKAVKYIKRLEELTGIPVATISTSPEREDTILVRDPFEG